MYDVQHDSVGRLTGFNPLKILPDHAQWGSNVSEMFAWRDETPAFARYVRAREQIFIVRSNGCNFRKQNRDERRWGSANRLRIRVAIPCWAIRSRYNTSIGNLWLDRPSARVGVLQFRTVRREFRRYSTAKCANWYGRQNRTLFHQRALAFVSYSHTTFQNILHYNKILCLTQKRILLNGNLYSNSHKE